MFNLFTRDYTFPSSKLGWICQRKTLHYRFYFSKWDKNFTNEIKFVIGDEWSAGNLSYHLHSRPSWKNELKKIHKINDDQGVIYTGNPKVLKKICPGVFGTIKPVGYCMIGKRWKEL